MSATQTVNGGNGAPDPDIVRRFHFTRDMVKGPVYRKYKFATTSTSHRTLRTGSASTTLSARGCSASPFASSRASRPSPTNWCR